MPRDGTEHIIEYTTEPLKYKMHKLEDEDLFFYVLQ